MGGAVGAGLLAAHIARPILQHAMQHSQDRRYESLRHGAAEPGSVVYPFPVGSEDEASGYVTAGSVILPGGAGLAALGYGVHQLTTHAPGLRPMAVGGGAALLGGALLGSVVGGMRGFAAGWKLSDTTHGIDVDAQTDAVMRTFDRNRDGAIDITSAAAPEFELRHQSNYGYVEHLSIEADARAADADADGAVTHDELRARLASIDVDGDGVIRHDEAQAHNEQEVDLLFGGRDVLLSSIN